ncbi:MAG TPA: gliding motility lipoprotein GldH [Chryseolinea sp.]|nr:gliding motility lipoprotein GldH [Chryseolinea sp.]HPH46682.1 gliding motility lipoprotein GldH [Chryseolinea sp.]HPM30329.1 gliding motility lipoprotein GldH [Chryseolinea sp.]
MMKGWSLWSIALLFFLAGCDSNRVYEQYHDFDNSFWAVSETPEFEFTIDQSGEKYNLYCNIRNSSDYPNARFFFTYYFQDSAGTVLQKELRTELLFDSKTGKPFGSSGVGDIYDHQFNILENYQFSHPGKFKVKFEQFTRTDTLPGILAVGLRVEKVDQ